MAIDLGDIYPLSIQIRNEEGSLANAGNVALTISLPDGSSINNASIAPTVEGVYDYNFQTTQVGKHIARWEATGANASAHASTFYVNPTDTGEFISLSQFKSYIKKTSTGDDDVIRTFIAGACDVINDRCGQVAPIMVVEDVTSNRHGLARLMKSPIISVTSIQRLPGLVSVVAADPVTGTPGWKIDNPHWPLNIGTQGTFRVTYRAGLIEIPQRYILAALELTRYLWKTSQQALGGNRPTAGTDEMVINGVSYAMPYNVRQLLGLDKRSRSGVYVG